MSTARRVRRRLMRRVLRPAAGTPRPDLLWRTTPLSSSYGFDRGTPIDRAYIDHFLADRAGDIRGRVLELQDNGYTRRFGGSQVTRSDVLHVDRKRRGVTIVADLCDGTEIGREVFDCIILTQTLSFLRDVPVALETLHRSLAPGGVLLVTSAGISKTCREEDDHWGHFWNLTPRSLALLLASRFGEHSVEIETYGNVLAAVCFLQGLAAEELSRDELELRDADFPVIVAARASKSSLPARAADGAR